MVDDLVTGAATLEEVVSRAQDQLNALRTTETNVVPGV